MTPLRTAKAHSPWHRERLRDVDAATFNKPTCIINAARMLNRHGGPTRIEASRAFARHLTSAAIS
jgi:hypothetical protein